MISPSALMLGTEYDQPVLPESGSANVPAVEFIALLLSR